jgi:hypothetical protein
VRSNSADMQCLFSGVCDEYAPGIGNVNQVRTTVAPATLHPGPAPSFHSGQSNYPLVQLSTHRFVHQKAHAQHGLINRHHPGMKWDVQQAGQSDFVAVFQTATAIPLVQARPSRAA